MSRRDIMLYLHVHQPHRLGRYTVFDTGTRHDYFETHDNDQQASNRAILDKVAEKSYLPMNRLLLEMLKTHENFKVSLSITGTFLEQCEQWRPDVLRSFQELVATGKVDIVAETYHHSLAFFYSRFEFEKQVIMHREKVRELFGVTPTVFRNTEFSYNNELGMWADEAGYKGVLTEGWDPVLDWRSPNYVYQPQGTSRTRLLLKNYRLSDDLAFRFSNKAWGEYPLTKEKYSAWLEAADDNERLINLCMDYETFGEHQWESSGIFDFMQEWVAHWLGSPEHRFITASEAVTEHEPVGELDIPHTITWADTERDLTAWLGNKMQQEALRLLYDLEEDVLRTSDENLIADWRKMQTSDHVYYMCTKWFNDGDVHAYFSPYDSPYDAFLYFMNALRDIRWRILEHSKGSL
jgi:alpha-amylase